MRVFPDLTIDVLIDKAKAYIPDLDQGILREAYSFAEEIHEGEMRNDEPYVIHPLETAYLMLDLKPDVDAILATLLHDIPRQKKDSLREIEKRFGPEVSSLIRDSLKLGLVQSVDYKTQVETFRRMFLAMARDLRVIFIRLADRLHNMMTLEDRSEDHRLRMAEETRDVYAPIASRLGIYSFKSQLEDLAFKYTSPDEHSFLAEELEKYGEMHQDVMNQAIVAIENFLKEEGVEADVSGRIKHVFSIQNKLKRKDANSLDSIYDIYALRIVLPDKDEDVSHLYSVLGHLHRKWPPLPHRFKDYVAVPKANGYRSLHTAIMGLVKDNSNPVEIQIRTKSMDEESRYGVAAHWWYKEADVSKRVPSHELEKTLNQYRVFNKLNKVLVDNPNLRKAIETLIRDRENMTGKEINNIEIALMQNGFSADELNVLAKSRSQGALMMRHRLFQNQLEWIEGLNDLKTDVEGADASNVKLDFFSDRIFVLTPKGEVKDLPSGATPVDFAYSIHTDVGHRCHQAKVDSRIAPLDYELQNGEVVEILTRKEHNPNRYWLSFVKTNAAANKIKNFFRTFDQDSNLKEGKDLLNKYLKRLGKPVLDPKLSILKNYGGRKLTMNDREGILESIGNGTFTVGRVIRKIFPEEELVAVKKIPKESADLPQTDVSRADLDKLILVSGHDDLPVVLSACCKPKYGQSIVGYVTRGKMIRVHRSSCGNLKGMTEDRLVPVEWKSKIKQKSYQAELYIEAKDRSGLLSDVATVIESLECNIVNIAVERAGDNEVVGRLSLEVSGYDVLEKILDKIEGVLGVKEVRVEK